MKKASGKTHIRRPIVAAAALCCGVVASVAPLPSARAGGSETRAAADEPGLVGTRRLVRHENTSADGKVSYEFGEHPFDHLSMIRLGT